MYSLGYGLKDEFNFKVSDITTWETDNCYMHIFQLFQEVKAIRK